jgi:hypothetical protein
MNDLKCPAVGRDKDNNQALSFYFNRCVTDDEMRFLHDVIKRAAVAAPRNKRETSNLIKLRDR